jgi:glucose/arabinose dehydrogenase
MLRALLAVALLLALPAPAAALRLVEVGRFKEPVYVTGVGKRVLVVERRGRIRELGGRVFADLRSRVVRPTADETVDQRGLLSVAFPRTYRGRFYAYYVDRGGRLRVDEFRRGRRGVRRVLDLGPAALQHHGGQLQFGPDGLLYVSTGIGDDPAASGQILRLDPRSGRAPEVYATGLRNPWRFSFARGTLIVGDVGGTLAEEINIIPRGGLNFGWPAFEGTSGPGFAAPALVHSHESGWCAITGGHVWRGRYYYGDLCRGRVRSARLSGGTLVDDRRTGLTVQYLASFGVDAAGRLYAVSFFGPVFRIAR